MKDKTKWNLKRSEKLVDKMMQLSEEGVSESQDDGCLLLYAVVRDCAYRIRARVETELEEHKSNGEHEQGQFEALRKSGEALNKRS